MSAPNVTVNRTNGGIGRQANGSDYYSGYLHYLKTSSTLPSGFSGGNNIRSLNSITDLIALGIDGSSSDEVRATSTITMSTAGGAGEILTLTVAQPNVDNLLVPTSVVLVSYTTVSGDASSNQTYATNLAAAINANTALNGGYTATAPASTHTVVIKAPLGLGSSINSILPTKSGTGTAAASIAAFANGAGSELDIIYYHVREAFRVQGILNGKPQGQIWLGIYNITASPSTYANFTEVATMQSYTNGQIKQLGVYATTATFVQSHVTALNAQAVALAAQNQPLAIIYQGDFSTFVTANSESIKSIPDAHTFNAQFVQCTVGQDGGNLGNRMFSRCGYSIGSVGTTLGAWALAGVQQSIISRAVFNVVDTLEFTKLAWANGILLSASGAGLSADIDAVDALGYVFLRNESSPVSSALFGGVFFNNDSMSVTQTSDYAYMPNIRTINKAAVGVRAAILPALGGNVYFNADGTLTVDSINYLQHLGDTVIGGKSASTTGSMASAGEISDGQTIIDPTQNVQSTNTVAITMKIVQAGVARYIVINIGFAASLK